MAAGLATGLAVLTFGLGLRPAKPDLDSVAVAAQDLPSGHRLQAVDLQLVSLPRSLLPDRGVKDPATVVGQVLSAPLTAGEPVATLRLAKNLSRLTPPGTNAVPIRFSDGGSVGLLTSGLLINIHAANAAASQTESDGMLFAQNARVIARSVPVMSVAALEVDELGQGAGSNESPLVVLALTADQAAAVIGAEASSRLTFSLAAPT